jgi:hypothetical protein
LWIGILYVSGHSSAAQDQNRPMFTHRFEKIFTVKLQLDLFRNLAAETLSGVGIEAPGSSIRDVSLVIDGGEIHSGGDIVFLQGKINSQRSENASPDGVREGLIAKEREVARSAPWRDAGAY